MAASQVFYLALTPQHPHKTHPKLPLSGCSQRNVTAVLQPRNAGRIGVRIYSRNDLSGANKPGGFFVYAEGGVSMKRMKSILSFAGVCGILLSMVACGGGGGTPPPTPTPTPSPQSVTVSCAPKQPQCTSTAVSVVLGTAQTFVANSFTGTVTWSVNGVAGGNSTVGTINTSGSYIAPANFPTPNQLTVTATAGTQTASATATVVYPNTNKLQQGLPVKLGSSGGNQTDTNATGCCIGTLGSLLNRGGTIFILSNNHVLDKSSFGTLGDAINQPGATACFGAATTVGTLTAAAALKPAASPGPAPSNVDAAIAQIASPATVDITGTILELGTASATAIGDAPPSATTQAPSLGLAVAKSGRTSGLTCSTIDSISLSVRVSYDSSCGGAAAFSADFANQVSVAGGTFSESGDSGSLIVTSATARPVALLYAGSPTNTVGNPVADVLAAFTLPGPVAPTFVGGGDHPVSCAPTQDIFPNSTTVGAASSTLAPRERLRVSSVLQTRKQSLMLDSVVKFVGLGASDDSPGEGVLLIEVNAVPNTPIPPVMDGVRTRVVYTAQASILQPGLTEDNVNRAIQAKETVAADLMAQPGIQGVGVTRSKDNPSEPAVLVFTIKGMDHPPIPALINGVRTQIRESAPFRAY